MPGPKSPPKCYPDSTQCVPPARQAPSPSVQSPEPTHHSAAYCPANLHPHPPETSDPGPDQDQDQWPVALLHASPIASRWRRQPILARRNLIRQAVPKPPLASPQAFVGSSSAPLNQTKRPLFCPAPVLLPPTLPLSCPLQFFVPPAPNPNLSSLPFYCHQT
ncbi:hypothetical protein V8C26DRAFT_425613 [Trichoderma gracile]